MPATDRERMLDAEYAVLGSLLIDGDISGAFFAAVKADDFYFDENRSIFLAARNVYRQGLPVDAQTVCAALPEAPLSVASWSGYLVQLMEITPTSANWKVYAKLMREQTAVQRVKIAAMRLASVPNLDECRAVVQEIAELLDSRPVHKPYSMNDSFTNFCNRQELPPPDYIRYGIPELDRMMFTERGDVIVIGGVPSSGKTAFALSLAWHIGTAHKTAFFSLETSRDKIDDRLMSRNAQMPFSRIKTRSLSADDWQSLAHLTGRYADNRLSYFTQENGPLALSDIESLTRAYGFEVVFIDYVQELKTGRHIPNIRERITELSLELHSFAQSAGVTVFELAQLSRPVKGAWTEPTMFDLKESGQLEQDADAVFLLYSPQKGHKTLDEKKNRFLKIAKNKEGITGTLILDFDGETQSFRVRHDSKEIMRELADAGRAAKARNRANAQAPYQQVEMSPCYDTDDMPF